MQSHDVPKSLPHTCLHSVPRVQRDRETGFGDDKARGFTIMYSPHQSFELPAHFKCCSYAMFNSKSCGVIEEGNRISSQLRPRTKSNNLEESGAVQPPIQWGTDCVKSVMNQVSNEVKCFLGLSFIGHSL